MPGKHITNHQIGRYMDTRHIGRNQGHAADAADISIRTARRLDRSGRPAKVPRIYLTRPDAFQAVWETEVVPLLHRDPGLKPVTLFVELQRRHPDTFADGQLRTLERRIRQWRAIEGPPKVLMFPQDHPPGWQALLDFTVCNGLSVTIQDQPLPHRLGHVCCPHSRWEFAHVILGGESYPALAETLRLALEALGGVPKTLRTDSLSAAYKNLRQQAELTSRFTALCAHYGCTPTRNNLGVAHENGAVESPNGHLKDRLDQALRLRESRNFDDLDDYRAFVATTIASANAPRSAAIATERAALSALPSFPPVTWSEAVGTVSRFGLITVLRVSYMVPASLIGQRLVVRIYDDRLEYFCGRLQVATTPRLHDPTRTRLVSYHHCIDSLVRKPGAFARLVYRDDLHPNRVFARLWEVLTDRLNEHDACQTYVRLLHLAHRHACENALTACLEDGLATGVLPDVEALRIRLALPTTTSVPVLHFAPANPASYDALRIISIQPTDQVDHA